MDTADLKTLSQVSRALWADLRRAEPAAVDAVTSVALREPGPDTEGEAGAELALRALLERAEREGMATNTQANFRVIRSEESGFYRLEPTQRLLLVALHLGRWSYARVARAIGGGLTPAQVEATAWQLRLTLAQGKYPAGPERRGPNCPEYDMQRPWTQRFFDEEIRSGQQRHFLQNHLMACDSCRALLNRCRDVYFTVDRVMPRLEGKGGEQQEERLARGLTEMFRKARRLRAPDQSSAWESLEVFVARRDVRVLAAVFGALLLLARLK